MTPRREPIAPGDEHPLFDLFREEVRGNTVVLSDALSRPSLASDLDALVGARPVAARRARIVGLDPAASSVRRHGGGAVSREAGAGPSGAARGR
ncbi:MAG: hypothetical protein U0797_27100 [Gemmataceae bacterium]